MFRIPHCLDSGLTDDGKVVSPTHPPHFTPQKHYYFGLSFMVCFVPFACCIHCIDLSEYCLVLGKNRAQNYTKENCCIGNLNPGDLKTVDMEKHT
jgi:hypothetical protein